MAPRASVFVAAAAAYAGVPYVLGAEGDLDPGFAAVHALDCSELVQVALADLDLRAPDGHWVQWRWCRDAGLLISVDEAIATPGALLFVYDGTVIGHVAISRGDGFTVEARGRAWGTGSWPAAGRGWTHGALVPGLDYSPPAPPAPPELPQLPRRHPTMIELRIVDDHAYPIDGPEGGTRLLFDGARVRWIRSGDALGLLARAGVPRVDVTLVEARALLLSFDAEGDSPSVLGSALAW